MPIEVREEQSAILYFDCGRSDDWFSCGDGYRAGCDVRSSEAQSAISAAFGSREPQSRSAARCESAVVSGYVEPTRGEPEQ
jgi:hypothetical protein